MQLRISKWLCLPKLSAQAPVLPKSQTYRNMIDRSGVMVKYTLVNKGIVLQMTRTCFIMRLTMFLNQHPLLFLERSEIPVTAMRF